MHELLGRLGELARTQNVDGYLVDRWRFHSISYLASGRARLVAEVERLFWRGERYHRLVLSSAERFARSLGWYEQFMTACQAHDGAGAEQVIDANLRWAAGLIADSLPHERDL
jgi:DNA-binding GntR family transcriptional regulator